MSDERRHIYGSAALCAAVLLYSALLFVLTGNYPERARVFPYVVTSVGMAVGAIGVAVQVSRHRRLTRTEQEGSPAEEPAAEEAGRGTGETSVRTAWPPVLGVLATALGVLVVAGIYAFSFVTPVLFMRVLSKHGWVLTISLAVGLMLFSYSVLNYLVQVNIDSWGLLSGLF